MNRHRDYRLASTYQALPGILAAALAVCGCGEGMVEDVEETSSEIVNGTSVTGSEASQHGLIGVYVRVPDAFGGPGPWFGRPCSATAIAYRVTTVYVLTARHCITTDGQVDANIVPASWIKVAAGATVPKPNPDPPSWAKPIQYAIGMGISASIDSWKRDLAIIAVTATDWQSLVSRKGILMAPAPAGASIVGYGYGLNVREEACYGNGSITTGAGVLRKATFTTTTGASVGQAGWYEYPYNSLGQSIICGDSGGPDIGNIVSGMSWSNVHGVHSGDVRARDVNTSTVPGPWVSSALEGLFVSPMSSTSQNLVWLGDNRVSLNSPPFGVSLIYNAVTKTIFYDFDDTTACLDWDSGRSSFVMATCNSSRSLQRWEVTQQGYIRNPGSLLCVRHVSGTTLELRACPTSTASQSERARYTWIWHPQP